MAGKNLGWANDFLELVFNATAIPNIADNAATSPLTNLYISLHTADPGGLGDQTTSEITYTSYARVAVARTSGGFIITSTSVSPASAINFPMGTGGTGVATHFGIGSASTGTGRLLYTGTITPTITCGSGIQPQLTTASTVTEA